MNKFNFDKAIQLLQQQKSDMPQALAEATQQYFNKSFDSQSWNGRPWKDVKRHTLPPPRGNSKPILQQSGALKNAVSKSLVKADFTTLKFEITSLPYAPVHNEGLKAGRGKGFQMPQRQFMGHADELGKIQKDIIKTYINKIWQK